MTGAELSKSRKRGRCGLIGLGLVASATGLLAAAPAEARPDQRLNLHIPPQRIEGALFDLALQGRFSLGGDLSACRGATHGLTGAMTLEQALDRLLAGSGCRATITRSGAVIIRRAEPAPAPNRRPPPTPAPAPAPDPDPDPVELDVASELTDVIVTAERRPDSPQGAALPVTALSGEQIDTAGAIDAHGLSALVAGMTVTNLGSGRNKILLRGMSDGAFTGQTQSTVGLYLNQVPITYNAPDPDLKLVDIDRVEILRGPQGALYGTGAIGGVVRIVTRRPDPLQLVAQVGCGQ
ncbi:MAG: TonB-dependent receptor plug domain-containing protein, partial [Brevundimonas sp.]|nr:TonB-dependent receptor plug domain-containing protein [Brevundimonas sp.]